MTSRTEMTNTLKIEVVPILRELGFRGSMPHFYRTSDEDHVDLFTIQFASTGGSFVVEIGFADSERKNVYFGKDTPPKKLRVSQTTERRRG